MFMSLSPVVGIVSEYNPFHLGHEYHLKNARQITHASACVCVMSSNFVQRGEPSIVSKWARAEMALRSGADLVIELPSALSCSSAEYFASGAVKILDSLGIVDYLCFGSEEGDLKQLEKAADILAFESDEFKKLLKENLNMGLSFAVSRQKALEMSGIMTGTEKSENNGADAHKVIEKPNNILGIEYIKAVKRMGSSIKPVTLERKGEGYNSLQKAVSFSSATAIRKHILEVSTQESKLRVSDDLFLKGNLPKSSLDIFASEVSNGRGPVFAEAFESILVYLLRSSCGNVLSQLPYMGEGLENRLKQAALQSVSIHEMVSSVVTSRYPASRIKRILMSLLTGMTHEFLEELKDNGYAQYVRILGFNDTGRKFLSSIKKKAELPIITKAANFSKLLNPLARKLFEHEVRASDAYALGFPSPKARLGGSDFTTSPIQVSK